MPPMTFPQPTYDRFIALATLAIVITILVLALDGEFSCKECMLAKQQDNFESAYAAEHSARHRMRHGQIFEEGTFKSSKEQEPRGIANN